MPTIGFRSRVGFVGFLGVLEQRSAAEVIADPGAGLNVTVHFTGVHRETEVERAFWFSFHPKYTTVIDDPPATSMPPYVIDIGGPSLILNEDLAFSGSAQEEFREVVLRNSQGELDELADYRFSGRQIQAWIGGETEPHISYEVLWTGAMKGDPRVGGEQVKIQVGPLAAQLDEKVAFDRYVGIPVGLKLLASGCAGVVTADAAFDLTGFAITARFRAPSAPASPCNIVRKQETSGKLNYAVQISADGKVHLYCHLATGGPAEALDSTTNVCDDVEHRLFFARDRDRYWYMAVDDELEDEGVPAGLCDTTAGFALIFFEALYLCGQPLIYDVRLYPYKELTELSALYGTRAETDENELIGHWRADDSILNTVTDYANGRDMTMVGVLDTDFSWKQTNRGEPEIAGQIEPRSFRAVRHGPAKLIDAGPATAGTKPRIQTGVTSMQVKIRAKGFELTLGTDWKYVQNDGSASSTPSGTGVVEIVTAQSEPYTYETDGFLAPIAIDFPVSGLVSSVISEAGGEIHAGAASQMLATAAQQSGFHLEEEVSYRELLSRILQPIGGHVRNARDGRVAPGFVLPPVSPGPFGGSVLEILGPGAEFNFSAACGQITGSHTVCAFFRTYGLEEPVSDALVFPTAPLFYTDNGAAGVLLGLEAGGRSLIFQHPELSPPSISTGDVLVPFRDYFVAGVWDEDVGVRQVWLAEWGEPLVMVAEQTGVTGGVTASGVGVELGRFCGRFGHVGVLNYSMPSGEIEDVLANGYGGYKGSMIFELPINEGEGSETVEELITGESVAITGLGEYCRWAPRAVFDLRRLVTPRIETRKLVPAWQVSLESEVNYAPLREESIAAGVTDKNERMRLKRVSRASLSVRRDILRRNDGARNIPAQRSVLYEKTEADRTLRNMMYRFDEGREVASLTDAGRRALLLEATDEVWIYSLRPSHLAAGAAYRVIGLTPRFMSLSADLTLWR